jgi:hypothetical protein
MKLRSLRSLYALFVHSMLSSFTLCSLCGSLSHFPPLHFPLPRLLRRQTRKNLAERLDAFVEDGSEVDCTDETLAGVAASVRVRYETA